MEKFRGEKFGEINIGNVDLGGLRRRIYKFHDFVKEGILEQIKMHVRQEPEKGWHGIGLKLGATSKILPMMPMQKRKDPLGCILLFHAV